MSHPAMDLRSGVDDKTNAACLRYEDVVFRKYIDEVAS